MDVFALRSHLVEQYAAFTRSFTTILAKDLREQVDRAYADERFWPAPLLSINPAFEPGEATAALAREGKLHPITASAFPIQLHRHQEEAISLASAGKSFVVTTGTGSGKSLCFFIPIVDAIVREKASDPRRRIRAIVIYPMNALANSQLEELEKYLGELHPRPVTFRRLTGQEGAEERRQIQDHPPDILLTNFMMLELLLTRRDSLDLAVMEAARGLHSLVLDELHTYRGRQGADVAMLVRRLRDRLEPEQLQCIGTSATMAS